MYDLLQATLWFVAKKHMFHNLILGIANMEGDSIEVTIAPVQRQMNGSDCGVFAVAFATSILYGRNPEQCCYTKVRGHLSGCLRQGVITPFPELSTGMYKHFHCTIVFMLNPYKSNYLGTYLLT